MERTEPVELTLFCCLSRGDELLLQNKVGWPEWHGYTFPGGHVEPGESIVGAAVREIREETGLTVKNPRLCGVKQFLRHGHRFLVFLFWAGEYEGELQSSAEGEMRWVRRQDFPSLEFAGGFEEFSALLQVMEDQNLSELRQYADEAGAWRTELR